MQPEKRKRVEDEFVIIDEQEEMRRAAKEAEQRARLELQTMTYSQHETLKSQRSKIVGQWALAVGLSVFFMLLMSGSLSSQRDGSMIFFWLIIGGFGLFSGIVGLMKWGQFNADLERGKVEYVEDIIALDVQGGGRSGPTYKLRVGYETFTISREMFLSLSNHQPYRVFYAPQSRVVVGAEPL
ncbi:MAG: hypothetical protein U0694_02035 [Anaerolineae bacterium]